MCRGMFPTATRASQLPRSAICFLCPTGIPRSIRRCRTSWPMAECRTCAPAARATPARGPGGRENAGLAGLPAAYIIRQIEDYKSGARKFAGPQRSPSVVMTAIAKAANEEEIKAAAAYFSSLKPKANIKVVETDTVPVTQIARVFYMQVKDGGSEPIPERIIRTHTY